MFFDNNDKIIVENYKFSDLITIEFFKYQQLLKDQELLKKITSDEKQYRVRVYRTISPYNDEPYGDFFYTTDDALIELINKNKDLYDCNNSYFKQLMDIKERIEKLEKNYIHKIALWWCNIATNKKINVQSDCN